MWLDTPGTMSIRDHDQLREFGQVIRRRRNELGLSQEELAHKAGMNRTYIGDIERGARNVALTNLVRLSAALNTTPSELLRGMQASMDVEGNESDES